MPVSPEEMAAMQAQAGKDTGGGVTKLAQQVGQGLQKLSEMLDSAPGTTDQDKQQMAQILSSFVDLVEKKLAGQEPGTDPEAQSLSQVPSDAGMNGKPMGPETQN